MFLGCHGSSLVWYIHHHTFSEGREYSQKNGMPSNKVQELYVPFKLELYVLACCSLARWLLLHAV